jgi:hypothetical protein
VAINPHRKGGQDVPIVDGGTNASDAVSARANLGVSASGGPRYIEGLLPTYLSITEVAISPGSCADSTNTEEIVLPADVTVDITAGNVANGLDIVTPAGTVSGNGVSTFSGSGTSFLTAFFPGGIPVLATGTATSSGTAVTGVGTKFTREYAVGDLIGSAAAGYIRVALIDSDTSLTTTLAFSPVLSSSPIYVIQNAVFKNDNMATGSPVVAIPHDTALIIVGTAPVGVTPYNVGAEGPDTFLYSWVVKGGSGVAGLLSTQRTTLLNPPAGYDVSARRVGVTINDSSGDLKEVHYYDWGAYTRLAIMADRIQLAVNVTESTPTDLNISLSMPPVASMGYFNLTVEPGVSSAERRGRIFPKGLPGGTFNSVWLAASSGNTDPTDGGTNQGLCPAGFGLATIQYDTSSTNSELDIDLCGWLDLL